MANWQEAVVQPSFRSINFYCVESQNEFGRRIALHEFPQHDTPYAEDMGRKARKFTIHAYVIGDDWESRRDKLIRACEDPSPGVLVHPDLGTWTVVCESCSCTESKVNAARKAEFTLTFIETGVNKFPGIKTNTASRLQSVAKNSLLNISKVFNMVYKLTQLPQYAADYVMGFVGDLTGIYNPTSILNTIQALQNLKNGDITLPWQVSTLISAYTASFNRNYSYSGTQLSWDGTTFKEVSTSIDDQTNTITARDAIKVYSAIANTELVHVTKTTPTKTAQYTAGRQFELLFKSYATIEAAVASSMVTYESLDEAQATWNQILQMFDNQIAIASELNDDKSYIELRKVRATFQSDIQDRAPLLNKIIYKSYQDPTPSLVIAYDQYEDITRADEIAARNHIRHPGYIRSDKLELLSE